MQKPHQNEPHVALTFASTNINRKRAGRKKRKGKRTKRNGSISMLEYTRRLSESSTLAASPIK